MDIWECLRCPGDGENREQCVGVLVISDIVQAVDLKAELVL